MCRIAREFVLGDDLQIVFHDQIEELFDKLPVVVVQQAELLESDRVIRHCETGRQMDPWTGQGKILDS